jgi:hypothetical protein
MIDVDQVNAIFEELESAGIIRRTGETRWSERSNEWQPVYTITELGKAVGAADLEQYLDRPRC